MMNAKTNEDNYTRWWYNKLSTTQPVHPFTVRHTLITGIMITNQMQAMDLQPGSEDSYGLWEVKLCNPR